MICTFPSKKYNIDDYLAVKNYLIKFGKKKLEQTGREYIVNGVKIKSRKKTNNKWFETQDSIAYSDLFLEQKIVYSEIVQSPRFYLDDRNFFIEASAFILTGNYLDYLIKVLNSKIFTFAFKTYYAGGCLGQNGYRYKKEFLLNMPVPIVSKEIATLARETNDDLIENCFKDILNLSKTEFEYIMKNTLF